MYHVNRHLLVYYHRLRNVCTFSFFRRVILVRRRIFQGVSRALQNQEPT